MSKELVVAGVEVIAKVIKNELIKRQNAKRKVLKRNVWVKDVLIMVHHILAEERRSCGL